MDYTIHTDGGARGNPGPAAVGVVIENGGHTIHEFGEKIGETTNNVAEYTAVVKAIEYLKDHLAGEGNRFVFYLDSQLVVNQLNGIYKIKDSKLRELLSKVRILEAESGGEVKYISIPREQNRRADFLVNQALDSK